MKRELKDFLLHHLLPDEEEEVERKKKRAKAAVEQVLQEMDSPPPVKRWTVEGRAPNTPVHHIQRLQIIDVMEMKENDPRKFTRMFRLAPADFDQLLRQISPILCPNKRYNSIDPIIKLICTLRYLAGGMYEDICFCFKVPYGSFYQFIEQTMQAIDQVVNNIKFHVSGNTVDDDVRMQALQQQEARFARLSYGLIRGTVAAVDGVVFRMKRPAKSDVNNDVRGYYVRKGYFAYGMQGMCDADCKFVSISSTLTSSSHDSTQYQMSSFAEAIANGWLPPEFHVVMDEAYPCREQELCPWSGKNLSVEKDAFNYLLSRQRQVIERAFGLLVGRWGVFWRPLKVSMHLVPLLVRVCCKLHNICVDRFTARKSIEIYHNPHGRDTDYRAGDITNPLWTPHTGRGQGYRSDLERCSRRERLTNDVLIQGYVRPGSSHYSRVVRDTC